MYKGMNGPYTDLLSADTGHPWKCTLRDNNGIGNVGVPSAMAAKKPMNKAFPSSEKCKRCHLRVFEEWEASAQSRSIVTSPFRITLERYLAKADKNDQAMCFQCHAPHIAEYGELLPQFIKEVQSKNPHMDGVGCPQCHLIHDVDANATSPCTNVSIGQNNLWRL